MVLLGLDQMQSIIAFTTIAGKFSFASTLPTEVIESASMARRREKQNRQVYMDGEQIPDDRIRDIFRWPPAITRTFIRSSLIVGSRGVGKTTLFRYLKSTHSGLAIHLALGAEFSSFGKDAAMGPLGRGYSKTMEQLIASKAISLLALSVADRLAAKKIQPDLDLLNHCLPKESVQLPRRLSTAWCSRTREIISNLTLEQFEPRATRPLVKLISDLGRRTASKIGPLLLLLDRADMVVPAALVPVAELLDQSVDYVALVAMRPGHASQIFASEELGAIPGDHYEVTHLGQSPYEPEWEQFLTEALQAQLGGLALSSVPEIPRRFILTVARDSLRTALELVLACQSAPSGRLESELATALAAVRESHLVAAQRVLQSHHPDYRKLVSDIRAELLKSKVSVDGPVHLQILDQQSPGLWQENSQVDVFIDAALRSRAACMPNGRMWVPGLRVREVEIPPAIIWHEGDPYWDSNRHEVTTIVRSEKSLFGAGGGGSQPASVFVAYRMDFDASRKFRNDLEQVLNHQRGPVRVSVVDGRVREGEEWAPVIRDRIKRTKLLVGDVTGLRNDVMFELGFGHGLRKSFIPVVESQQHKGRIPAWLRIKQIGSFATENELISVASSVVAHISDRGIAKPKRVRDPVPGLAIWLRSLPWCEDAYNEFEATCGREGLTCQQLLDGMSPETWVDQAPRASLLIAVLDHTEMDALVHFICGAVVAHPTAGYASKSLARRVLIICRPGQQIESVAAESLLRCSAVVTATTLEILHDEVYGYASSYRTWLKSADED